MVQTFSSTGDSQFVETNQSDGQIQYLIERANENLEAEEFQQALEWLEEVWTLQKSDPQVAYKIGLTCLKMENWKKAIRMFKTCLKLQHQANTKTKTEEIDDADVEHKNNSTWDESTIIYDRQES